jgi:hypothetical protein
VGHMRGLSQFMYGMCLKISNTLNSNSREFLFDVTVVADLLIYEEPKHI